MKICALSVISPTSKLALYYKALQTSLSAEYALKISICYFKPKKALQFDKNPKKHLTPMKIDEKLCEYIIGQQNAKKTLAVAIYNHYKRISNKQK